MNNYQLLLFSVVLLFLNSCSSGRTHEEPNVSVGSIKSYPKFKSNFIEDRTVVIWLPKDYDSVQGHAVLYMHDGQNLFDATLSYIGVEWGIDETIQRMIDENKIKPTIVVGIYNTPNRYFEYLPEDPFKRGEEISNKFEKLDRKANSNDYLKFITEELKPFIDANFNTLPGKNHTAIAGSSMGGLISLYAMVKHPEIFGSAACISTHWPIGKEEDQDLAEAHMNWLNEKVTSANGQKFYFDFGTETLDAQYEPYQNRATHIFLEKGYLTGEDLMVQKFEGDEHSERAWSKRVHIPLEFILNP